MLDTTGPRYDTDSVLAARPAVSATTTGGEAMSDLQFLDRLDGRRRFFAVRGLRGCELVCFVEDEQWRDRAYRREVVDELLPAFERPDHIEVVERFPLNRRGKPAKRQLGDLAAAKAWA